MTPNHVAIIGFGEVGRIFAEEFHKAGIPKITAYDVLFSNKNSGASRALPNYPVTAAASAVEAVKGADFVVASVTASNTKNAAASVATGIEKGAFYLDINSASPGMKQEAAAIIERAGGRYVEAAVMTAVPPHRIASPMLLGGPHMDAFIAMARPLGFNVEPYDKSIGKASSVKMCRSVMIKGVEALVTECMLTARSYGVEKDVLACLGETLPVPDWEKFARYLLTRTVQHGRRRAEEMREVARTVSEAGVDPRMSAAIAERQDESADLAPGVDLSKSLFEIVDALREAQKSKPVAKLAE